MSMRQRAGNRCNQRTLPDPKYEERLDKEHNDGLRMTSSFKKFAIVVQVTYAEEDFNL